MKKIFLLAAIILSLVPKVYSQDWYVAAKSGLSIREKPDAKAAVIGKIPYGTKITVAYPDQIVNITTEGILGAWAKTTYAGKTGYVVNSYLFLSPPPKATVKTMKDYLLQLSPVFGARLVVKSGNMNNVEEGGWELHKQLYKNGAESHKFMGYEYGSDTYFLPEFTMQQAFLLLRLVPEFKEVVGEKDEFPLENKTIKKEEREYRITVDKEMISANYPYIKKITIEYEDGAIYSFEMYQVDTQLVIFFGSGV
jgi:hypothetical protein